MRFFQPLPIERYVHNLVNNDREAGRIFESWEMEREDIEHILVEHFRSLGLFTVFPMSYAWNVRKHLLLQLHHSPDLKQKLAEIRREIERTRAKHRRDGTADTPKGAKKAP